MNIVLFKGKFDYNVVNLFMYEIFHVIKEKGHKVTIIDTCDSNAAHKLSNIFNTEIVDLVISFGMANNPLLNDGRSLYDASNTTLLAFYVDHPSYHLNTLTENIKDFLCCFNDKEHIEYLNEILPTHHKISFFLPQGGLRKGDKREDRKIKCFEKYKQTKSIDIVFSGTFPGEIIKPWENNEDYPSQLLDEVTELLIYDNYLSVNQAFKIVFDKYKIKFSSIGKVQLANLYSLVQNYLRAYSRIYLLTKLIESGLNITICGNDWDDFAKKYKNINYIGPLDIEENIDLINNAKVLINSSPTLRNGSHERVFTGMLNNTVLFSDRSRYYDEFFEDEKSILYYSFNSLDKDIEKLKAILSDDKKLFEISQNAYEIANKYHTWENRVDTILDMVKLSKLMDK